ncbi:hypothetical protein KPH14_009266 [Odynerus spinipes]|uniref:Venom protein n=1 Tax=Odynerus spinipes TaxID=1348599 RepID=A0AAD9RNZ9_9HYME|nr:hypothetical protein KPH14_009266 [Odynerus spinipes]
MKYWILLCIFSLLLHFSMQDVKFENCSKNITLLGETMDDCLLVKCNTVGNSTKVEMKICDVIVCDQGKQTGYHEGDGFATFPDCCSYPICAE